MECRILSCLLGIAFVLFVFDVVVFCTAVLSHCPHLDTAERSLTTDLLRFVFPMFWGGGVVTENRC